MTTRGSDDEHTAVWSNGTDRNDREASDDLSRMSDRRMLERVYRQVVGNEERISLTYNALEAHRADEARRWRAADRRQALSEEALFELVASDRARRAAEEALRKEHNDLRAEVRQSIAEVRTDLEKRVAEAKRVSLVDEQERAVVVDLARTGAEAARAHIGARAKQTDLVVADQIDALEARKERRSLLVAGLKRIAPIAVPVLTAAAGALAMWLSKGC